MTQTATPPGALPKVTDVSRTDHELISFAVFLDYRARRMRAEAVEVPAPETPYDTSTDRAIRERTKFLL